VFIDLIDAKRILREIKLLRHFNAHENIVTILDIMSSPPGSVDIQDMYIVTNLMESDLERIIRSHQNLTDQHFQYFLYQVRHFFCNASFFVCFGCSVLCILRHFRYCED
jgi:mitogen-activated protein kinase 1/3